MAQNTTSSRTTDRGRTHHVRPTVRFVICQLFGVSFVLIVSCVSSVRSSLVLRHEPNLGIWCRNLQLSSTHAGIDPPPPRFTVLGFVRVIIMTITVVVVVVVAAAGVINIDINININIISCHCPSYYWRF